METIYEEFVATVFFAVEGCWDPRTMQDGTLESTPLGTAANYRSKAVDATMCYIACKQKWASFSVGPLVQCFPSQIPPRKYLKHDMAQKLKLPFTCKEAYQKLSMLIGKCKSDWDLTDVEHGEQMKLCYEILELGCYCLPGEVIASEKVKDFVDTCLKMDVLYAMKKIRQGKLY